MRKCKVPEVDEHLPDHFPPHLGPGKQGNSTFHISNLSLYCTYTYYTFTAK